MAELHGPAYGHACGDRALCGLAATCIGLLREIDMVGRMGGEEFTIIMPETIGDEAMLVADTAPGAR